MLNRETPRVTRPPGQGIVRRCPANGCAPRRNAIHKGINVVKRAYRCTVSSSLVPCSLGGLLGLVLPYWVFRVWFWLVPAFLARGRWCPWWGSHRRTHFLLLVEVNILRDIRERSGVKVNVLGAVGITLQLLQGRCRALEPAFAGGGAQDENMLRVVLCGVLGLRFLTSEARVGKGST